ncbi:MAG TPA: NAD-binding protein [Phycisphaerae bacterium]|nr:NAD-binding protein [Phycisphaerae bacterium]HOJ72445.1 NAD-binding protein [Phycisphaerae bacterium]HOM49893.1 NAD-binding protein [Phycisphaerae bacterium]HON67678.1 NAD-binding protein [Phycisphaerae bacterium]HOQ84693.1 NAD-binding protein [Phycisphaerae bacterium]
MTDSLHPSVPRSEEYLGYYENGVVRLAARTNWPNGTPVCVRVADLSPEDAARGFGKVIIAGFGLAGRWVAEIFDRHHIEYVVVDKNPETIETQRKLNRQAIQGNITEESVLRMAGIEDASVLILTIPDEDAVVQTTALARRLRPDLYILARTTHASAGLRAAQCGADEVIKAEQAVARQFYEALLRKVVAAREPATKTSVQDGVAAES